MEGLPRKELLERKEYFAWLSQYNEDILSRYVDREIVAHLRNRTATIEECQIAQEKIQRAIFVSQDHGDMYDIMMSDKQRFKELTERHTQQILNEKADLVEGVLERGIVPILVRPDMAYLSDQVVSFLEEKGFEIVATKTCQVSFDQYWGLYNTELLDPTEEAVMRKRAFRYINRPLSILLVRHKDYHDPSVCAQMIAQKYKGRAGFQNPETVRGGIFYDEVCHVLEDNNKEDYFALDPLMETAHGGYNHVPDAKSKLHVHVQGIHIPNPDDVVKDLSVLLTREEMEALRTG